MQTYRYVHLSNTFINIIAKIKKFIVLFNESNSNKLNIIKKYKCKINNKKVMIYITNNAIILKQDIYLGRIFFEDIKKMTIKEKTWCIRVVAKACHENYKFDFKNDKQALSFYKTILNYKETKY